MHHFKQNDCLLCGAATANDFCPACYDHLPRLSGPHCPVCLRSVTTITDRCGICLTAPPNFTHTIAALHYTFPIDALIHALKYRTNLAIAPILAKLLFEQISHMPLPDYIIPMPLHPNRLKQRGFNQALEISRHLSTRCCVQLLTNSCRRIKHTTPQTELPWKLRQKNVRNAFECDIELTGKNVAIVDDVMTTGATLNELAKVLRKNGASTISNWVIARTPNDYKQQLASLSF